MSPCLTHCCMKNEIGRLHLDVESCTAQDSTSFKRLKLSQSARVGNVNTVAGVKSAPPSTCTVSVTHVKLAL